MTKIAVLIGNTDGIGAESTKRLLELGYQIIGISRSAHQLVHPAYKHIQKDVTSTDFRACLQNCLDSLPSLDLCIYFAGIGAELNLQHLNAETKVFEVNLMGAVITTELALTKMQKQNSGHFIGISSLGDMLISSSAPSYTATKIGLSRYWEGLGLALKAKKSPVHISNIRFGFVDTKMAQAPVKPFQLTRSQAADFILNIIACPRIRASKPKVMLPLVWLVSLNEKFKVFIS